MKGGPGSGHHGHGGRPGKHGGSAPGGMAGSLLSAPTGDVGVEGNRLLDSWFASYTQNDRILWRGATDEERSELKAQVARDLAEASGVSEQEAADFVKQWAHSSNDDDMRSLALQKDAAAEFGVKTSAFTQGKIDKIEADKTRARELFGPDPGFGAEYSSLMESTKQRAVLRAMYDKTQTELKVRGIKEVKLYRGMTLPKDQARGLHDGDITAIATNSLESWSIDITLARRFAIASTKGEVGILYETIMPANRILSTPGTGFGCLKEGEVVALGGVAGDMAAVVYTF